MQALTEWRNPISGGFVIFSPRVLRLFRRYRQNGRGTLEAGGVILGFRKGIHLEVCAVTPPQTSDFRTRFSFIRWEKGHQRYASLLWNRSHGRIDYLGEWHTHPEPKPHPSLLDLSEWKGIAYRLAVHQVLMVIVGTRELVPFVLSATGATRLELLA